jgi:hypothetical protein
MLAKVVMSKEGLVNNFGIQDGKYLYWTDEVNTELPIIIREGDDTPL